MVKKSTQHLLLQNIYGETSKNERNIIEQLIQDDFFVKEEQAMLLESYQSLPKVKLFPPKKVIRKILAHSQSEVCV